MLRYFAALLLLFAFPPSSALSQNKPGLPTASSPELRALIEQGNTALDKSDWQRALGAYEKARIMAQQQKDIAAEAMALGGIGSTYVSTSQLQKALQVLQQALQMARQANHTDGEATVLNNLGIVYQRIGQFPQAKDYYQQALLLYQHLKDPQREAAIAGNIGIIHAMLGEFPKALEFLQRSLPLRRQLGDKFGEASTLASIGSTYASMGQTEKGLKFLLQALPLRREVADLPGEASTLSNLGLAYRDLSQYQNALNYYEQSLTLSRRIGIKNSEATALYNIGSVHILLGNLNRAEFALEQSLALREQIRAEIGGNAGNRQAYLTFILPNFARLAAVQMDLGQGERAFATINRMKGRTLLEQVANKSTLAGIPLQAQQHLQELRQQNDRLSVALAAARGRNKEQEAQIRTQLQQAERDLNSEQDRLFSLFAGAAQRNVTRTLTLAETTQFLPADTALLEFAALKVTAGKQQIDRLVLTVITASGGKPNLTVHSIATDNNDVEEMAETLRNACTQPKRNYKPLARKLGALLLPPDVIARLEGKQRLVVCPDGELWSVPFAVLLLADGKHLIEHFEIDYAYSATGAHAALTVPHSTAQNRLLVLANPDFGDTSRFGDKLPDQIAKGVERPISEPARPLAEPARPLFDPARLAGIVERGKIKSLPGTQIEADAILQLYPDAKVISGTDAQEAALVSLLPQYRYLHFATHGLFSDASPLQSALVLAQPPRDSADDGFLTAREIYAMNLNAEMAVLSACETARGEFQSGEGIVGLTWALFAAGVPTQVVSQWKVSDASTPQLMTSFYGNLKNGQGKGKALRNAALTMMQDGKHSHPYHWAAFVLFGDWQ